jgi:5-methylcytosine-specific restriction endonuclease McrA
MTRTWYRVRFDAALGCEVKGCSMCHTEKPVTEFYKRAGGYRAHCKPCEAAYAKNRYDADPEKMRAYMSAWAKAHPEQTRARYARWHSQNRERRMEYYAQYNATHLAERRDYARKRHAQESPELKAYLNVSRRDYFRRYEREHRQKRSEQSRRWQQLNPDKHAEKQSRRRAWKANAPIIERIDRNAIIERDKWMCYLCGVVCTRKNVTLDHIVPLSRGGNHTADNLRVACRSCNSSKGPKFLTELE